VTRLGDTAKGNQGMHTRILSFNGANLLGRLKGAKDPYGGWVKSPSLVGVKRIREIDEGRKKIRNSPSLRKNDRGDVCGN